MPLDRRKKFIVDSQYQKSFIGLSLVYIAVFVVLMGLSLFLPFGFQLGGGADDFVSPSEAAGALAFLKSRFWLIGILPIVAIITHAVHASHKVAGPLVQFRKVFLSVKEGRLPKQVVLRKSDHLKTEMDVLNAMVMKLRLWTSRLQEDHAQLEESLGKLQQCVERGGKEEVAKQLAELSDQGKRIGNRIASMEIEQ